MIPLISTGQFKDLLPKICDKQTSSRPDRWIPDNPLKDHCAVVTLVANNLFGGQMLRAEMVGQNDSHYWNRLPDGTERDFTGSQFDGLYPELANTVVRERSYVLYDPKTGKPREIMGRYKLLAWRLAKELNGNNPLFDDPFYKRCFYAALESPCQKMKFGCVLRYYCDTERAGVSHWIEIETFNKTVEPLKSFCEPNCIRLNIPSRTESMIGACGHAEEFALWEATKKFISIGSSELYVAGVHHNGLPSIRNKREFTCLRCAVQIYHSGIRKVFVPVINQWQSMSGEECVKTAKAYAIGEKKI